MSGIDDFLTSVIEQLGNSLLPLSDGLQTADNFSDLLQAYGWNIPSNAFNITDIQNQFTCFNSLGKVSSSIDKIYSNDPAIDQAYLDIINALSDVLSNLKNLSDPGYVPPAVLPAPFNTTAFWSQFAGDLKNSLFSNYLRSDNPTIFALLIALGIIDITHVDSGGVAERADYAKSSLEWSRLLNFFSNPIKTVEDAYGWTPATFNSDVFLLRLTAIFASLGALINVRKPSNADLDNFYDPGNPTRTTVQEIILPVVNGTDQNGNSFELDLVILPIPKKDGTGTPTGIAISPSIAGTIPGITLGNFSFNVEGSLSNGLYIIMYPQDISVKTTSAISNLDTKILIGFSPSEPIILIGASSSFHVEVSNLKISLSINGSLSDPEIKSELIIGNGKIVLDFTSADSFISNIISQSKSTIEFQDVGIVWSSKTGISFKGSASLQTQIDVGKTIGPILIDSIFIGISQQNSNAVLSFSVSGSVNIGPIGASIEKIGSRLVIKSSMNGNAADITKSLPISLEFNPPAGIGLSIDAGPVTGGGYIQLDPDKGEYAGILQVGVDIPVTSIEVTIIGILDTKLPGGVPGYSFLLIVTSEFTPIELGFGFTLNGVGGLAGINRSMNLDQLKTGFKNHITPFHQEDPIIPRAPQIISQISSIFPVTPGSYVFGFMLELGWGDPQIIDAELGIILELPDPIYIVLLGTFKAGLPTLEDPDLAIVLIQIDILGIIDFEHQQFTLQGILYDSRVVEFQLSGGMAMLLDWSPNPQFIMSVGGFYPSFPVPTGFPTPDRLTITYGISGVNLTLKAYFAVTSNSAQVGAHLEVSASAAGFTLEGHLNFDALFIFNPFSFVVDMSAGVSILAGGSVIMSIQLDFTLSGPKPLHGHGAASFCILCFSVTIPVDFTIGDAVESQPATKIAVLPLLQAALQSTSAWSSQLPNSETPAVTYAKLPSGDQTLYVDPMGSITIRQKVVPLNTQIDKFGSAMPTDGSSYNISAVSVNTTPQTPLPDPTDIEDEFARGQFQNMSDSDKISKPSFEKMPSGTQIGTTDYQTNIPNDELDLYYDTHYIEDPLQPALKIKYNYQPSIDFLTSAVSLGASANSMARNMGSFKYVPPGTVPVVTIKAQEYAIVETKTMAPVTVLTPKDTSMTAVEGTLQAHIVANQQDMGQMQVVPVQEAQAA